MERPLPLFQIFSSPELRCVQTAAAISHAFGKPEPMIHIEPALAEWVQINPNSASEWLTAEQVTFSTISSKYAIGHASRGRQL